MSLHNAKQILDYTHAKQNIGIVKKIISDALKLSDQENKDLSTQVRDLLWNGNINEIVNFVREKLARKRSALKTAMKKLNDYFGEHSRF